MILLEPEFLRFFIAELSKFILKEFLFSSYSEFEFEIHNVEFLVSISLARRQEIVFR